MDELPGELKQRLRGELRAARRAHAAGLPREVSALVFNRPPAALLAMVPEGASIGLYRAHAGEAPTAGYARFFLEAGHTIALPRIAPAGNAMSFHQHTDPYDESDLEPGPTGLRQPRADAAAIVPQVLFMPVVGFTPAGDRLGQGGGFYDRWLGEHPETLAIGMAWDMQEIDILPLEPHDVPLAAIVTPTRLLGPFERSPLRREA